MLALRCRMIEVITNNPDIERLVPEDFALTLKTGGTSLEVFTLARDRIHLGAKLLAHPMAGRLRPNETPYAAAVLEGSADGSIDFPSLEIIEYCLAEEHKYAEMPKKYDELLLPDLRFISCELFQSILQELNIR